MPDSNTSYNSAYTGKQVDKAVSYSACANATGNNSIALGWNANASNDYSIALGYCANATGTNSIALGWNANATGTNSIALGWNANVTGNSPIALGRDANASNDYSTALGQNAHATGNSSIALGWTAHATGTNSIALGRDANATGTNSIALGWDANATGNSSIALGWNAHASNDYCSTALGQNAHATGNSSTALGWNAHATGNSSIALGRDANATGNNSIALGYCANASANTACIRAGTHWRSFNNSGATWSGDSDRNDKADISTIACGLDVLKQLRPVTFRWNQRAMYRNDGTHDETIKHSAQPYDKAAHKKGAKKAPSPSVGFLAQEVEATLTQTFGDGQYAGIVGNSHRPPDDLSQEERDKFIAEVKEEQERGLEPELSLAPDNFIPWIVRAIQELDNRVTILEKEHNIVR